GGGAFDTGAHAVLVVLDDVNHRQLQQRGEIEALKHLALVGRALAEIGDADIVAAAVPVAEAEPGAEADLGADDAMATVEMLRLAEHVHRPALAVRVAGGAAGEFGHDAPRLHAGGE